MPNFIIIPERQNGFTGKPLFLSSSNLLLEKKIPGYLYTSSLHYHFNTKYEALPNIEHKLAELTFVVTNGNKYFIGMKYNPSLEAPMITMRGSCITTIKKYCVKNNIPIVNNRRLAAKLYECNCDEYIPVECYEEVVKIIVRQPAAYNDHGCTYCDKDDYDRAINSFTKAIRLDPNYSKAYKNRGLAYNLKGDYDSAIADCTEAIRLYYNDHGCTYCGKNDYDCAIAGFPKAIQLAIAAAYTYRGIAYFFKDNYTQAHADINIALRIDPNNQDAQFLNEKLEKKGY